MLKPISVVARQPGYYQGHRHEGQRFDFFPASADDKPPRWMRPVDGEAMTKEAPKVDESAALAAAVAALDPADDSHWTKAGLPSCDHLGEICGFDVSRKAVEAAAPGVVRPVDGANTK